MRRTGIDGTWTIVGAVSVTLGKFVARSKCVPRTLYVHGDTNSRRSLDNVVQSALERTGFAPFSVIRTTVVSMEEYLISR